MKLVVATGNPHKLEEFRRILQPLGIETLSLKDVNADCDVDETGETFLENARIKAEYVHRLTGLPAVADDSGICVDALDGRPGVHSARYQGEDTPHEKKVAALLAELEGVPDEERTCRFTSAICCALGGDVSVECEESCEGRVGDEPRGHDGFGYDPIFVVVRETLFHLPLEMRHREFAGVIGKTFAELGDDQKDGLSHRGKALRLFAELLQECLESSHLDQRA